jgi:hypothetical protein
MAFIKTMTIDGFYTKQEAINLSLVVKNLQYTKTDFGYEIEQFNAVSPDSDELFSSVLGKTVTVDLDRSGVFREPELFIHFEDFNDLNEWLFVVALERSTCNIFEHQSGAKTALDQYKFGYRNLFEWDLTVNYLLEPGQGIFFRPWLFHSFDQGLIQMFRLKEL